MKGLYYCYDRKEKVFMPNDEDIAKRMNKLSKEVEREFMKKDIDEKQPKLYLLWSELDDLITKNLRNEL